MALAAALAAGTRGQEFEAVELQMLLRLRKPRSGPRLRGAAASCERAVPDRLVWFSRHVAGKIMSSQKLTVTTRGGPKGESETRSPSAAETRGHEFERVELQALLRLTEPRSGPPSARR